MRKCHHIDRKTGTERAERGDAQILTGNRLLEEWRKVGENATGALSANVSRRGKGGADMPNSQKMNIRQGSRGTSPKG